ncbi:MAG: glycosyltransferase [Candidatus Eisenbacteria bacterium]
MSAAGDDRPVVAQLVTPYLFLTGSWIHSQIRGASPRFRSIVLTQATENLALFPHDAVFDLSREREREREQEQGRGQSRGPAGRIDFLFQKYLLGRFPPAPYVRIAQREGVQLLHAHLGWEGARTIGLRKALGVPFVVSFYGQDASMLPRKAYWRRLYRRLFREADRVLAEGSAMARRLVAIGAPEDRVRILHLGVDLDRLPFRERRPDPAGAGEIVALMAASFREKKGIVYALEALARVAPRHPRLRLRIIGDGPLRGEIAARASRPDLAGKVELLGYRPFPDYLAELSRAHLFLSPSVTAADGDCEGGAPVCILEAQAVGLPVLATEHCDIPEATLPGRSALLAPERDAGALAARLDELLAHPGRWLEMGRAGRAHVEAEFDLRRQGEKTADLYEELLRSRAGARVS